MSIAAALAAIKNAEARAKLNGKVHIISLSFTDLARANGLSIQQIQAKAFSASHTLFVSTIKQSFPEQPQLEQAVQTVLTNRAISNVYVSENTGGYLVQASFGQCRAALSKISKKIRADPYFGKTYTTSIFDVSTPKNKYKGKTFILPHPETGALHIASFQTNTETGRVEEVYQTGLLPSIYYLARKDSKTPIIHPNPSTLKYARIEQGTLDDKPIWLLYKKYRQVLDVGHGELGDAREDVTSVLGYKIKQAMANLTIPSSSLETKVVQALQRAQNQLIQAHNLDIEYANLQQNAGIQGYLIVSAQKYTKNNSISIKEAKIAREVTRKIEQVLSKLRKDFLDIPGSNSIKEDAIAFLTKKVVDKLTAKPLPDIKKHAKVNTQLKTLDIKVQAQTNSAVLAKNKKPPKSTSTLQGIGKFRDAGGRFQTLNLTNLQNLLNQRLHDQIRANMGTGSARAILNYRSGRLAHSAQVERMSESRAGMIQAFYTYMKYPYATFSDGGAQQYPKSRDPKLLIAKSIREIAGTTVANRMRAVNI